MDAAEQLPDQLQHRHQVLTEENVQLLDQNERLLVKVGYLEGRLGHLAASNTDLSCRLVQSEEDKLKISKELVEEKIESNKMRERLEEEAFELKNKLLTQDGVLIQLQLERDRLSAELDSARARLAAGEQSGRHLGEEHAALQRSHRLLAQALHQEEAQSQELGAELLALARAQDALRRRQEEQQRHVETSTKGLYGELERVQALIQRLASNRVKPEDLAAMDKEQKSLNETLLGNQDELRAMLDKLKQGHEQQQRNLEEKLAAERRERQESEREKWSHQQKVSELRASLLFCQSQVKEAEEENSKLQLQSKELNEEYRARLLCYLRDAASYIDSKSSTDGGSTKMKIKVLVEKMLQDVRSSHRAREEQLASAARFYRKRLHQVSASHQALLIAYRAQREQILTRPEPGLDPGPPEASFSLEPTELRDQTQAELQRLRQDKARLQAELQEAQAQVAALQMPVQNSSCPQPEKQEQESDKSWTDVRTQLKEITHSTLVTLEMERALLVTRATVAEAQVSELHDYIDNHLGRYKEEITHLRTLHKKQEAAGPSQTADSSHHQ